MSEDSLNNLTGEEETGLLSEGLDLITDAISGISLPQPVKKNAFKAFGRLFSAAVEIPAVYLEGIADERRAESKARVKLIETNATQIARQMEVDPEYARVAVRKFGQKIIREQVNLDLVSAEAAKSLRQKNGNQATSPGEIGEIEDDWLNQFEERASKRSSIDMQRMFGRILAGEIRQPSSFSIRSIKILGEIDKSTAELFKRFCSSCIVQQTAGRIIDARLISFTGNPASNSLLKYGFAFSHLNLLQEYGLIISDYNSWSDYQLCVANKNNVVSLGFTHQKSEWALAPMPGYIEGQPLKLSGVALSKCGQELIKIIDIDPVTEYTNDLKSFFESKKLKMLNVKN